MAALFYAIVGDAGCQAPPLVPDAAPPDAAPRARPDPLPPIDITREVPDAAVVLDDATMTLALVERFGLIGRESRWVGEFLADDPHWKPVAEHEDRVVWKNGNNVTVTFLIEDGHVVGTDTRFDEKSFSADLTALSFLVVGSRDAMPLHWEEMETHGGELRSGEFELEDGRVFYYRGRVRTEGQEPYGPERFEVRATPFP